MANRGTLTEVDWNTIPAPTDDGGAAHLPGTKLPALALPATAATAKPRMPPAQYSRPVPAFADPANRNNTVSNPARPIDGAPSSTSASAPAITARPMAVTVGVAIAVLAVKRTRT